MSAAQRKARHTHAQPKKCGAHPQQKQNAPRTRSKKKPPRTRSNKTPTTKKTLLPPRSAGGCCWIPDHANMLAPDSGSFTGPEQTKDGWHLEAHPKSVAFPQALLKQCSPCIVIDNDLGSQQSRDTLIECKCHEHAAAGNLSQEAPYRLVTSVTTNLV